MPNNRHGRKLPATPAFSPFEAGACVAPDAQPSAVASLDTPAGADHMAAVEAKRIEMLTEWDGKIEQRKARAAELTRQADAKRAEAIVKARFDAGAATQNTIALLHNEAGQSDAEVRQILRHEIPELEQERMNIGSGTHSTLALLRIVATNRMAAEASANRPNKLPSHVILERQFGWHENEQFVGFAEGQIVRDPALIGQLIARGAPLELGALTA
jgi:hypothetical protein